MALRLVRAKKMRRFDEALIGKSFCSGDATIEE